MKKLDPLKFSTSPILAAIPETFLQSDIEDPFTMVFWSRGLGNTTPQMFVIEGQGEAIWKSFSEKILDVANVELAELSTWTRYLERDELETAHREGRLVFGMEPDPKIRQWITISNRPGRIIHLDEHGTPIAGSPIH